MISRRLSPIEREACLIAESALTCADLDSFHHQLLERLGCCIGFDLATVQASADFFRAIHIHTLGFNTAECKLHLPRYMDEYSEQEVAVIGSGRPVLDSEIVPSASRRNQRSGFPCGTGPPES